MTCWSHGYNVSTGYTYGFYRETAPDWLDFALALRGLEPPRAEAGGSFRYLELGCGQGFGLCLLAASNPHGDFLGVDFSPEHVAHAEALAAKLGLANIRFVEGDFAELGEAWPADLGQFDYVTLHGIYSWVPKNIREALVAILNSAVRPGGAVYVSFNAMPGWVSTMPFQHILSLLETSGTAKGMKAIDVGRDLFGRLDAAGSAITKALPGLKSRIEATRKQPPPYLVQEYLHENWHPLWCSQVMAELAGAKLDRAASATLAENLLPHILPGELQKVLADHGDQRLQEDLTDCIVNQTFRRDIYLRGVRRRFPAQSAWQETYHFTRLNAASVSSEISISTAFGSMKLQAKNFAPLLGAMSGGSSTLAELAKLPAVQGDFGSLQQTLLLLVHAGWLGCGRGKEPAVETALQCNAALAGLAGAGAPYRHLAAPKLGSAVPATDSELLMLDCYLTEQPAFEQKPASMLKQRLDRLGRRLAKDGKPLSGEAETGHLESTCRTFLSQTLPTWRRLGVVR